MDWPCLMTITIFFCFHYYCSFLFKNYLKQICIIIFFMILFDQSIVYLIPIIYHFLKISSIILKFMIIFVLFMSLLLEHTEMLSIRYLCKTFLDRIKMVVRKFLINRFSSPSQSILHFMVLSQRIYHYCSNQNYYSMLCSLTLSNCLHPYFW